MNLRLGLILLYCLSKFRNVNIIFIYYNAPTLNIFSIALSTVFHFRFFALYKALLKFKSVNSW